MSEVNIIPAERIERQILLLRGQKVMLDFDLAALYGVPTKVQIETLEGGKIGNLDENTESLRSQIVTLKRGQHLKYAPYAFTEQGVAMLSSVLRSPRAVQVNIAIIRTFVQLRQLMSTHADLEQKLKSLESKYDAQFKVVFDAIRELMSSKKLPKREMGFHTTMPKPGKTSGNRSKTRKS